MKYKHEFQMVPKDESIEIPDNAEGITTDSFGVNVTVHYLIPVNDE